MFGQTSFSGVVGASLGVAKAGMALMLLGNAYSAMGETAIENTMFGEEITTQDLLRNAALGAFSFGTLDNVNRAGNRVGKELIGEGAEKVGKRFKNGDLMPKSISGSKPKNSPDPEKWLKNGGSIDVSDGVWTYTNKDGVSVRYDNGYPNFKDSDLVQQEVDIGEFKNYYQDFKEADRMAPNGPRDPGNTWHHHQDGKTMQEMNKDHHKEFTHRGGMSAKKRK